MNTKRAKNKEQNKEQRTMNKEQLHRTKSNKQGNERHCHQQSKYNNPKLSNPHKFNIIKSSK